MKRLVTACVAVLILAGCSAPTDQSVTVEENDGAPEVVETFWTKTVDGRRIPCVWASGYNKGGLSCDWSQR